LFFIDIFPISDLHNSLFGIGTRKLGVNTYCDQHVGKIKWSTVETKHSTQKSEFKSNGGEETYGKSKARFDGTNGTIDTKDDIFARSFMERCV